jgi:flavin reductase (DIM6/NTAB) family NADH-FMN oxidoreductase RutF
MTLKTIPVEKLALYPSHIWSNSWFLLSSGDFQSGQFNAMTVAWGSMGYLWQMPFVQIFVRPSRYTFQFMNKYDTFTLCAFPEQYKKALNHLGSKSGRDGDKIVQSGLSPVRATRVEAAAFAEAELVIECRKMYWQDLDPAHFLDARINRQYSQGDIHRVYFGEILAASGSDSYLGV